MSGSWTERTGNARKARGLFAPFQILDAVKDAIEQPFEAGIQAERARFLQCVDSPQRAGLVHAFFAERKVRKAPETESSQPRPIATAGVIGGGTMGSGIAVALLDARGFRPEDFARSHPGGALGRRLLTHVSDVMRSGTEIPRVPPGASFSDLMREMSAKGLGASAIVGPAGEVLGIFTDGDLRRCIEAGTELRTATAGQLMHARPKTVSTEALAVDAAQLMEQHGITSVMAVDAAGRLAGIVHIRDLMRAKVI